MDALIEAVTGYTDVADPGSVLGLYLAGSAVAGGLRPSSDVDLVMITKRSLTEDERRRLLHHLLSVSEVVGTPPRPLELTCIVASDVVPWRYPPICDFQYGEWLRADFEQGLVPERHPSPDLAIALVSLSRHHRVFRGAEPRELLGAPPVADLRRAVLDCLPELMANLDGDERNVILTLARMIVTVERGEIVAKDEAVRTIEPDLGDDDRAVVRKAAEAYLRGSAGGWSIDRQRTRAIADRLADRITRGT